MSIGRLDYSFKGKERSRKEGLKKAISNTFSQKEIRKATALHLPSLPHIDSTGEVHFLEWEQVYEPLKFRPHNVIGVEIDPDALDTILAANPPFCMYKKPIGMEVFLKEPPAGYPRKYQVINYDSTETFNSRARDDNAVSNAIGYQRLANKSVLGTNYLGSRDTAGKKYRMGRIIDRGVIDLIDRKGATEEDLAMMRDTKLVNPDGSHTINPVLRGNIITTELMNLLYLGKGLYEPNPLFSQLDDFFGGELTRETTRRDKSDWINEQTGGTNLSGKRKFIRGFRPIEIKAYPKLEEKLDEMAENQYNIKGISPGIELALVSPNNPFREMFAQLLEISDNFFPGIRSKVGDDGILYQFGSIPVRTIAKHGAGDIFNPRKEAANQLFSAIVNQHNESYFLTNEIRGRYVGPGGSPMFVDFLSLVNSPKIFNNTPVKMKQNAQLDELQLEEFKQLYSAANRAYRIISAAPFTRELMTQRSEEYADRLIELREFLKTINPIEWRIGNGSKIKDRMVQLGGLYLQLPLSGPERAVLEQTYRHSNTNKKLGVLSHYHNGADFKSRPFMEMDRIDFTPESSGFTQRTKRKYTRRKSNLSGLAPAPEPEVQSVYTPTFEIEPIPDQGLETIFESNVPRMPTVPEKREIYNLMGTCLKQDTDLGQRERYNEIYGEVIEQFPFMAGQERRLACYMAWISMRSV
jgi:hypothetical protein